MSATVIVTRADPGGAQTLARLEAEGYTAIRSPMLEIVRIEHAPLDLVDVRHLIFTSMNGVEAFVARSPARDFTVWCVGPSTAEAARQAGFSRVHESEGGSGELAELILSSPDAAGGRLLHVANLAAAGDLVRTLRLAGRDAGFTALYETRDMPALSATAAAAIESGARVYVLIHSAKGARAFKAALAGQSVSSVVAVAISAAAGAPLHGCGLRAVLNAPRPTEDGLFLALEAACLSL